MGEVLRLAAHLPDAVVGLTPDLRQMLQPGRRASDVAPHGTEPALARQSDGIGDLPVDVELKLAGRGIADAYGRRAGKAGKPRHLPFVETPLARKPIHDLHLIGAAADRPAKPVAPSMGLLAIAGVHKGKQRKGL